MFKKKKITGLVTILCRFSKAVEIYYKAKFKKVVYRAQKKGEKSEREGTVTIQEIVSKGS